MTQEEFDKAPLLDQILYDTTGMLVENHPSIAEAMDKYHQSKLKLLGIADVVCSTMFKQYRRKQIAELRPVTQSDIMGFIENGVIHSSLMVGVRMDGSHRTEVSISQVDEDMGSPQIGDMIARNPKNHSDQWLVAKQYFEDNFEPI